MYAVSSKNIDRTREGCGRRGYKNSEPSVDKIFNDEGRYEGILDLSQRGLPGAFLSLSRQLPGHTPNHFVPRDLLQD